MIVIQLFQSVEPKHTPKLVTAFINLFARLSKLVNEVIKVRDSYNLDHDANFVRFEIGLELIPSVLDCG